MRYSSFSPTGLPRSLNEHVSLPPPGDPARPATDEPVQQAAPSERDDRYLVRIQSDPARALAEWHRLFDADTSIGPFQDPAWLAGWYRTLGRQPGIDAIFATVLRDSDGKALLGLPLLRRRSGGLRWIEPADLGVSDYNGPWLARDFPTERRVVERVLHALQAAMKLDADVLRMGKLPAQLGGQANPLLRFPQLRTCAMHGHLIRLQDDYAAWRRGQAKRHRKHLDRCWRVLERHDGVRFRLVDDAAEADVVLSALEALQRANMRGRGRDYRLDQPPYRQFYRDLADAGLGTGQTVLSALYADGQIVAAAMGIRRDDYFALLRIGRASGHWDNCSPGRLLVDRTLAGLHARGVRQFDLTIGDYAWKRGFLPELLPLYQFELPLSWRGQLYCSLRNFAYSLKCAMLDRLGTIRRRMP